MKKGLSWLLMTALLLGMLPMAALAAPKDTTVTEYRTSYDDKNYFELSVKGNELTISGVCSKEKENAASVYFNQSERKYFPITTGQAFKNTFSLDAYQNEGSVTVEIYTCEQEHGTYWSVFYGSDISLSYESNAWSFDLNNTIRENNREISSRWSNPGDALWAQSKEIVSLSNSIVKGETNQYEKLRLIHNWVADNIYYDRDSYRSRNIVIPDNPMDIVKDKKTVCQGYAELTQALVQAQNIPCLLVSGYALGVSTSGAWTPEEVATTNSNHAWNEAFVDGHWVTMDVTWDSNNKYENGSYNKRGQNFPKYFNISEEQFAQSHKILERASTDGEDTPDSWAQKEIAQAFSLELIPYSLQGDYAAAISRSEFCALAIRMMEKHDKKEIKTILSERGKLVNPAAFTDCSDENVLAAYALGIVKGKGNGIFDPKGKITRQEAAVMLKNAANLLGLYATEGQELTYRDQKEMAPWAISSIQDVAAIVDKTTNSPVMKGTVDGTFSPKGSYTREQAYCTMLRMFHALS